MAVTRSTSGGEWPALEGCCHWLNPFFRINRAGRVSLLNRIESMNFRPIGQVRTPGIPPLLGWVIGIFSVCNASNQFWLMKEAEIRRGV